MAELPYYAVDLRVLPGPLMNRIEDLARLLDRHTVALGPGIHESVIEHVALVRSERPSEQMHTVYNPCLCIVAQGAKRSIAGSSVLLAYGPGQYLAVSVEPSTGTGGCHAHQRCASRSASCRGRIHA